MIFSDEKSSLEHQKKDPLRARVKILPRVPVLHRVEHVDLNTHAREIKVRSIILQDGLILTKW